jgi:hypothetical protein
LGVQSFEEEGRTMKKTLLMIAAAMAITAGTTGAADKWTWQDTDRRTRAGMTSLNA